jgi:hypothetical protein
MHAIQFICHLHSGGRNKSLQEQAGSGPEYTFPNTRLTRYVHTQ